MHTVAVGKRQAEADIMRTFEELRMHVRGQRERREARRRHRILRMSNSIRTFLSAIGGTDA